MDYKIINKILFAGDWYYSSKSLRVSSVLLDFCQQHSQVVVNLEAPFVVKKDDLNLSLKSGPVLSQGIDSLSILKNLGVGYVGCANNHIMDKGVSGFQSTKSILDENSITYFGCGNSTTEARQEIILSGTKIALIGLAEEEFGVAEEKSAGINSMYDDEILYRIKELSNDYLVVIYAHGGGEQVPFPSKYIINRYRSFIDSGAKLVVGHHPHVIQGFEDYNQGKIYYSLGNLFHQYYPKATGALLSVETSGCSVLECKLSFVAISDGQLDIVDKNNLNDYLNLNNKVLSNKDLFKKLHQEQAIKMYEKYYEKYLISLFGYRFSFLSRLNLLLRKFNGSYKQKLIEMKKDSQRLLLNLIRNKTHNEFIETALKIKVNETVDLRNAESATLYKDLSKYIKYE